MFEGMEALGTVINIRACCMCMRAGYQTRAPF